jgi:serine/threonine protein kinase
MVRSHSKSTNALLAGSSASSASLSKSLSGLFIGATAATLPLALRIRFSRDCCAGIAFLHACGFIHCDVKSLNFLVTSELVVKLSDLGEARKSHPDSLVSPATALYTTTLPRNINWSAPEVMRGDTQVGTSSDVWSLALVISEVMSGDVPFDTPEIRMMTMDDFLTNVQAGMRPTLPYFVADVPNLLDMVSAHFSDWIIIDGK